MKIQGNDAMAAADKDQKLAELDKKILEVQSYLKLSEKFN
jgi:hypothetical protein